MQICVCHIKSSLLTDNNWCHLCTGIKSFFCLARKAIFCFVRKANSNDWHILQHKWIRDFQIAIGNSRNNIQSFGATTNISPSTLYHNTGMHTHLGKIIYSWVNKIFYTSFNCFITWFQQWSYTNSYIQMMCTYVW